MFLPHRADRQTGEFRTLTDAVGMSRYYAAVSRYLNEEDQNLDSWERYFQKCSRERGEMDHPETYRRLCGMMMTKDEQIGRMFGEILPAGRLSPGKKTDDRHGENRRKSCGMLLARSIVENVCRICGASGAP